ncbi:MAG: ABC transporter permease [Verrucomicrobiota bacterium]
MSTPATDSTLSASSVPPTPLPSKPKKGFKYNPNKVAHVCDKLGLGYFSPIARLIGRDEPAKQLKAIALNTFLPILAFAVFLIAWNSIAAIVVTESQKIPSPAETWAAWESMVEFAEIEKQKEAEFLETIETRATGLEERALAKPERAEFYLEKAAEARSKEYLGNKTFFDQIYISVVTIAVGFLAASLIAIPIGILCGVSPLFNIAVNPLVQLFKPVSPLAWFPIVFVITTWGIESPEPTSIWQRALFSSAGVVTLCSLWPTLINTAVGVASVDKDHLNVAKVLKLNWMQRIWKIVLPASLPLIFTGLRVSIGVGWMVLIAADMMAQNQGLGKFVWDMYQNGRIESFAQITVAIFFIGGIGFLLDRIMLVMQRLVTFEEQPGV